MGYLSWGNWVLEEPDEVIGLTSNGLIESLSQDIMGLSKPGVGPTIGFTGPSCAGKSTVRDQVAQALEKLVMDRKIGGISEEMAGYPRYAIPETPFYGKFDVMDYFDPDMVEQNQEIVYLIEQERMLWGQHIPTPHQLCFMTDRIMELVQWISSRAPSEKCFQGWYDEDSKGLDFNETLCLERPDIVLMDGDYLMERRWYPTGFCSLVYMFLAEDTDYIPRVLGRESNGPTPSGQREDKFAKYKRLVKDPTIERFYQPFLQWIESGQIQRVFDMRDFSRPKELLYHNAKSLSN